MGPCKPLLGPQQHLDCASPIYGGVRPQRVRVTVYDVTGFEDRSRVEFVRRG
jgi:hypothetical protein